MSNQRPIKVLVVDDSAFMRKAISSMFDDCDDIEVVGSATNGLEAIELTRKHNPDLVTLDVEMPTMDGLTALRQIKRISKAKVIMISSLTTEGSQVTLTALRLGADDFMAKDSSQISLNIVNLKQNITEKIRDLCANLDSGSSQDSSLTSTTLPPAPVEDVFKKLDAKNYDLLLIGSSTGGPPVLEHILSGLPDNFPLPIVIAQHMPSMFTESMSGRLNELSLVTVHHLDQSMALVPGHVYVTRGGKHAYIKKSSAGKYQAEVLTEPSDAHCKPSIDVLFDSAAKTSAGRTLAIVLTGMSHDGLEGARQLHAAGATILAQDHDSCVVYGMPKAVAEAGLIQASLTPDQITKHLRDMAITAMNPSV
ncbi:MAG: protein-glutamate methylesterase/protein-glutamine glutaminase [Planctomycetota bacterium]|jgi:two-component system chemotaxis response regulator CheB